MILLIDNYDSFTYNLSDYFARLGQDTLVLKNDEVDAVSVFSHSFSRIVISPGPNTPAESGNLMQLIEVCHNRWPILGVCLGHQALGQFFGAELVHARQPVHGKVSRLIHNGSGIYSGLPRHFSVCRYHSLILRDLQGTPLRQCAETAEGECMGFEHETLPVFGMQYHPEAILTEHGLDLLANWLRQTAPAVS